MVHRLLGPVVELAPTCLCRSPIVFEVLWRCYRKRPGAQTWDAPPCPGLPRVVHAACHERKLDIKSKKWEPGCLCVMVARIVATRICQNALGKRPLSALAWMCPRALSPPWRSVLLPLPEQWLSTSIVHEPSPRTIYQTVAATIAHRDVASPLSPIARPPLPFVFACPTVSISSCIHYPADCGFTHYGEGQAQLKIVHLLLLILDVDALRITLP